MAHSLIAGGLFAITLVMASVIESRLRGRPEAKGRSSPEWTFYVLMPILLGCVVGAVVAAFESPAPMPGGVWWPAIVGIIVIWLGIGLRAWSVATLGRFFQLMVVIQDDHRVINDGPYRYVRHPAYLGSIIYAAGIGLVASDWVSLGLMVIGFTAPLVVRIRVEERALVKALGNEYALYMQRTARLLPGVY